MTGTPDPAAKAIRRLSLATATSLLELIGLLFVVIGIALVYVPAALIAAGGTMVLVGWLVARQAGATP